MSNSSLNIKDLKKPVPTSKVKTAEDTSIWKLLNKDISISGKKLPDKIKEPFYLELGILLEAGVDIRAAMDIIKEEQAKAKYKQVFSDIQQKIITGSTLSAALQSSESFTPYEYFSVHIGEETGKLSIVLKDLAAYFQKRIKQRRQIIAALTYPVVILLVAFGAVSFMITYVVPMFADVLKRFGGDLPYITKVVLSISRTINGSFSLLFLIVVAGITFVFVQRKKVWFRKYTGRLVLKLPLIGPIVQKIYLSRLATTMALLISSKIPLLQAIQLINKMIAFYPIEQSLLIIEKNIETGKSLHKSMNAFSIYPAKMILLLKVGEEVNQLELFFQKIADQYNNEIEHQTNMLSKLLEPVIIIILGVIVGVILIAMYLPLFKLGQTF